MKNGHQHYAVKALVDTSSSTNFISESLINRLGIKYAKHLKRRIVKNLLGNLYCIELSFQYKEKDRLLRNCDEVLPWLWLREAKIDVGNEGIRIYGDFVPYCKY
jgi:hypothetical protein